MLEEITRKVVSYCEIPEEITENHWISENSSDTYVEYSLNSDLKYSKSELDLWLEETYPELIDTTFFIHLD
jgi:hypothetical protein